MKAAKSLQSQLDDAHAEIAMQNEMIVGARIAASRLMCANTEMRHALDRIWLRNVKPRELRDQFELVKLIAKEAVKKVQEIEAKGGAK